jgi:hypothetical protein
MVKAKHLLELLSRLGAPARVCLADRAQSASWRQPEAVDSRRQAVVGSRQVARLRASAVEYSLDFPS